MTFFVGLWVANYLGATQYGVLAYAMALVTTLSFFASWGVETLVIADFIREPNNTNRIASTYFYVRLCGGLLVPFLAIAYLLQIEADRADLLPIVLILSLAVACLSFDVADCYFQATGKSARTSMIRASSVVFGGAFKIALIVLHAELWLFAVAALIEAIFMAVLYAKSLKEAQVSLSLKSFDRAILKNIFIGGIALILSAATVVVYSKIDLLVVGANFSESVLGNYAIAVSMCGAWNLLGISICQAFAPYITRAKSSKDLKEYQVVLRLFLLLMLVVSLLGSLILSFAAKPLFALLLGEEYAAASLYFQFLIWISIPTFLGIATSQIIVNEKQYWVSLLRTTIGLAVTILLIYPAMVAYGIKGVIGVMLLSSCINTPLVLVSSNIRKAIFPALGLKRSRG